MRKLVHEETYFLNRLSEGKRVVDIYNYYEKDKHSLMVLELLEGGELFSVVGASNYTLTELKCAHFTLDMVKAINYIHENQVGELRFQYRGLLLVLRHGKVLCQGVGEVIWTLVSNTDTDGIDSVFVKT